LLSSWLVLFSPGRTARMIEQLTGALLRFVEGNVGALLRKEMRTLKKDQMDGEDER